MNLTVPGPSSIHTCTSQLINYIVKDMSLTVPGPSSIHGHKKLREEEEDQETIEAVCALCALATVYISRYIMHVSQSAAFTPECV